jgi:8-oxo-dGTP pyrophosphatase MutT (NUDIX family)
VTELRTDKVCVLVARGASGEVVREVGAGLEFLQLLRARDPARGSWQPVMGTIDPGESAAEAGARELAEETGLTADSPDFIGAWALETVEPFYWHTKDAIVFPARFVVEVRPDWTPTLDDEHEAARWIAASDLHERSTWTTTALACEEARRVLRPGSDERRTAADLLRVDFRP